MGRILAIDYGQRRVGLAVTDPLKIISSPLTTVPEKELFEFLKNYFDSEEVELVVVGEPKKLDSSDTNASPLVRKFVKQFRSKFDSMPLELHDERYTSSMAMKAMISGGMKKKDRRNKENVDKISATIILQSYLESINR
ncbi:MAG: Holliday junction resolvase RuvX [Bacteroidota bacterium]